MALRVRGPSPDYDSAGVSIEGALPRAGHLGAILYGPAAQNRHPLENGRSLFATLARLDPGWGIVEYNATDLKQPEVLPTYAQTYRTLRELFNFDGSQIAMMAWNGSNGRYAGQPGYVPHTAWRNTPGEEALFDFLADRADLPRGARLWTFGTPRHADDDGWSLAPGRLAAGRGFVDLAVDGTAALTSPGDQVLRAGGTATLVLGFAEPARLARVAGVRPRARRSGPWTAISAALPAAAPLPRRGRHRAAARVAAGLARAGRDRRPAAHRLDVRAPRGAGAPAPHRAAAAAVTAVTDRRCPAARTPGGSAPCSARCR